MAKAVEENIQKVLPSVWALIGEKLGSHVLCEKIKSYYTVLAEISGLISGFTFVVTSSNIEWKYDGYFGDELRTNLFGICLLIALVLGIWCTLLSVIIYGNFNAIGSSQNVVMGFVTNYQAFIHMPVGLLVVSIGFMLLGVTVAIDGLYSKLVFWIIFTLEILCAISLILYLFIVQAKLNKQYIEELQQLPSYQDKEE